MLGEGLKDVRRDSSITFPVHGVGQEVLFDEGAAGFLPSHVRRGVVWGGEAGEVGRFREGDWGWRSHDAQVMAVRTRCTVKTRFLALEFNNWMTEIWVCVFVTSPANGGVGEAAE